MKTLRILIRLNAILLAFFGLLMAMSTYSVTIWKGDVYRYDQEQAPLIFLGTSVVVLAVVLFVVSDFALVGHRRKLGNLLAAGNLVIAVAVMAVQPSYWGRFIGWIPALVLLIMAIVLAWASRRPPGPDDTSAELAALQIPEDVREALLRQIGEAAAQEERNRLARDLHDSIKQQLFTINVSTAAAQELWERDPEKAQGALADVRRSAREAMVEMQALLHQLTPRALTSAGLVEALREQCEALGYRTGAEVKLELGEAISDDQLPPGAQETLFRIAQEALSNVARHARARTVRVWLGRESEAVLLCVADDGQGFESGQEPTGMGLRNLKERAEALRGNLAVDSALGQGTRIAVRIPLNPPQPSETPVQKALREAKSSYSILWLAAAIFLVGGTWHQPYYYHVFWTVALLLPLVPRSRKLPPDTPPESISLLRYERYRNHILRFLLVAWWAPWHLRLEEGWTLGRYAWLAVAITALLLSLRDLVRFHQASRRGDLREIASSIWARFSFFFALGMFVIGVFAFCIVVIALAFTGTKVQILTRILADFQPDPIKISFLAAVTPVLLYVLSRQPRPEGAPS